MEQQTINTLSTFMPNIGHYRSQFSSLNSLLGKTTLTGKISSLDIAENLFEFMETTQQKFNVLQDKLIDTLIEQNFINRYEEASTSASIISDLLNQTLHERSLDTITLAKGSRLIDFLSANPDNRQQKKEVLLQHFKKYITLSTIYHNIMIFDMDGNIMLSLDSSIQGKTKNEHILGTFKTGDHNEALTALDFYNNEQHFINAVPVYTIENKQCLGCLVTIFNFNEEIRQMCQLFPYHLPNSVLVITNEKNKVAFSDNVHYFPIGEGINLTKKEGYNFVEFGQKQALAAQAKHNPTHATILSKWTIYRIVPLQIAFDPRRSEGGFKIPEGFLNHSSLRTDNLDAVILEAENINEDLGDVVINGEIIASKSRSYALNPILDSIRLLSDQINALCIHSIENLQKSIFNSLFNIVGSYTRSSVQLLDRYCYEKSNDCRWLGHSNIFSDYLKANMRSQVESNDTYKVISKLENISKVYTSYADIVLFNANGAVLANSHLIKGTHQTVSSEAIVALKTMTNSNRYYLSNFEVPQFSGVREATYTFMAPVCDETNHFLGGIAFVIKIQELKDILLASIQQDASLFSNNEMFAFFVDQEGQIISSTKDNLSLSEYNLESRFDFRNPRPKKDLVVLDDGTTYLVALEPCIGYREFKPGSHKNLLACCICIKVRNEHL